MLSIEKRITALIRKLQKNKVFQSRWYKALTALAIVVVFCTTYALILPAVTLTGDPNCGEEEHTHTDACKGEVLICGYDDAGAPQAMMLSAAHTDPFEPICGKEEHIHTDECYELQNVKVCFNEDPTHQHNEFCFQEELVLTCRQKEHVHGPECFPAPDEPDEQEPHVHTDACYAEEYICGQTEHTHTDACYAEPDETEDTSSAAAAAEDEEDANSTIAKPWEIALSLTGDTKADIVRVAESQLGYKESTEDYIEDTLSGSAQGYTIYGDWYGEPYGEWSAIFAAYCLNQAGVDEFDFPYESDPLFWMEDLRSAGLLKNLRYTPEEGDLVFLDTDTDGMADKVGIINEIDTWSELFTCVVGDSDNRVEEQEYFTMDFEVLAYAAVRGDEFAMPDIDADMKPGALDDMDSADVELELDSIFDAIPELPEDVAASEAFDEMYGELPAASEFADGELDASSALPEMSAPARPLSTEVFTYKDEDVRIAVTLPAGAAVPADATLEVTPVTAFDADYGMIQSLAQEALDDSLAQEYLAELEAWGLLTDSVDQNAGKAIIGDLTYYNVCFVTADGDTLPLEEGAQVTVRFADGVLPVAVDTADYSVLVYSDDGSTAAAPETLATEWTSSAIRFTAANSISGFAVVSSEEYNTASIRGVTADDGSARVVVELPDGSSVPQAASLSVTRVLPGEPAYDYYRLLDQANEKLAGIEDVVLYDISFTLDDMTYDVPDTAQVSIRLLDDSLPLESEQEAAVLRYGHSSELPGIVSARAYLDAGSPVIAFETEGFAVFGIAKVSESDLGGTYAIIAQTEADPDALAEDAEPYNYYALTANEQTVGIVTGLQGAEVTMNDSGEPVAAQNAGVAFWKLEKAQEAENGSAAYTVQEAESGAYLNMDAAGALTLTTEPQEFTLAQSGDGTVTLTAEDATLALLETEDEGENLFAADSTDSATFGTPVTALSLYDTLLVAESTAADSGTLEFEGEDYTVTVTYGEDAALPENVELVVTEYEKDSDTYLARYAEVAAMYGWNTEADTSDEDVEDFEDIDSYLALEDSVEAIEAGILADEQAENADYTDYVRLFDISLVADGAEVEPAAAVSVSITYNNVAEEIENATVIHFADSAAAMPMTLALDDEMETENAFAGEPEVKQPETTYDMAALTQTFTFELDSFSEVAVVNESGIELVADDGTATVADSDYTISVGGTVTISVSGNNRASSSDTSVATVSTSGGGNSKTLTITGVSAGTATITYGNSSWTVTVTNTVPVYVFVSGFVQGSNPKEYFSDEMLELLNVNTLDSYGYFAAGVIYLDMSKFSSSSTTSRITTEDEWDYVISVIKDYLYEEYSETCPDNLIAQYAEQIIKDIGYTQSNGYSGLWLAGGHSNITDAGGSVNGQYWHLDIRFETVKITYIYGNNGITQEMDDVAYDTNEAGSKVFIKGATMDYTPTIEAPDGWKIVGYYTTSDFQEGTEWNAINQPIDENTTVYIKIVPEDDVVINYVVVDGIGGTVTDPSKDNTAALSGSENFNPTTGKATGSTAAEDTGYTFVGWYSDPSCSDDSLVSKEYTYVPQEPTDGWEEDATYTYYAKFVPSTATITITKVDAEDNTSLSGAEFYLYKLVENTSDEDDSETSTTAITYDDVGNEIITDAGDADSSYTTYYYSESGWVEDRNVAAKITLGSGTLTLDVGTYYLEEIKAPDGYNLLPHDIEFTVSTSGITVNDDNAEVDSTDGTGMTLLVKNEAGYALPSTGGRGTRGYTIAGMILICSAAYVLYRTMRKRKEGV